VPREGLGASGVGGARARARPPGGADPPGEAGADGEEVRPQGRHEGDLAAGEPEAGGAGNGHKHRPPPPPPPPPQAQAQAPPQALGTEPADTSITGALTLIQL